MLWTGASKKFAVNHIFDGETPVRNIIKCLCQRITFLKKYIMEIRKKVKPITWNYIKIE